jgi:hypothetical protein
MLKYLVDTIDAVPDALRANYERLPDGRYRLAVEGLPTNKNLEAALKAERAINKALKAFGSPDEIAAKLAAADPTKFNDILVQRSAAWEVERGDLKAEVAAADARSRAVLVDAAIITALREGKATPAGIDILPDILKKRIDLALSDGKFAVTINGDDGHPMKGTGVNGAATFADLIAECRNNVDRYGALFYSNGMGGGGAPTRQAASAPTSIARTAFDALPAQDRMNAVRRGTQITD